MVSSSGFVALCAFAALAFNARSLGPKDFGTLAVIQAYVAFISGLCTFESWLPVIRLCAQSPQRLGSAASCGMSLDVLAATLAAIIAICGILMFGTVIGVSEENRLLAVIYSFSLFAGVAGTPKGVFRLNGRYDILVGNQLAQGVAMVVSSFVLWTFDASLFVYVGVLASIGALYNLTLFARLILYARRENIKFSNPLRSRSKRRFFRVFLAMATGTSFLSTLVGSRRHIALFLVSGILGEVAAGSYSAASRLATMVSRVAGPLNQVVFPEIAKFSMKKPPSELYKMGRRITIISFAASGVVALLGIILRQPIMIVSVGPAYSDASLLFAILFAAECFGLAGIHFNPLIQTFTGAKPLVKIMTLAMIFYVPLSIGLAFWWGAPGVAWAGLIVSFSIYMAMAAVSRMLIRRRLSL
ncbi:oligosaccharide flippase family protein [Mesorhizobium sp.]|uniref:lipopolysaccharide biosynthesis protein n=1 Tax=Mesorhizobium sp. TaxID=1871066 RepID=UPI002580479E|nr:oligosaccharide flippase family protein [Mesorhizobium sp.]